MSNRYNLLLISQSYQKDSFEIAGLCDTIPFPTVMYTKDENNCIP